MGVAQNPRIRYPHMSHHGHSYYLLPRFLSNLSEYCPEIYPNFKFWKYLRFIDPPPLPFSLIRHCLTKCRLSLYSNTTTVCLLIETPGRGTVLRSWIITSASRKEQGLPGPWISGSSRCSKVCSNLKNKSNRLIVLKPMDSFGTWWTWKLIFCFG